MDLPANFQRDWVKNTKELTNQVAGEFVLISYNILNADLNPEGLYRHCPDDLLSVARRHPLLMKEIDHHNDTDIFCLQEASFIIKC